MYSFLLWVVVTWVFTSLSAHFFSVLFSVWMHTLVKIENPQQISSIITESYSPGPVLTALSRQCWWAKAHSQACSSLKDVISRNPRNVCFLGNPPWIVLLWLKLESREFEVSPGVLPISIADPWCDDGMDISSRRQGASLVLIWIHMTSRLWWKLPRVSLVMGHMFPGCRQGPESLPPLSMAVGDLGCATPKLELPPASERPLSACKHTHAQTPHIMCSAEWTGFFRRRLWKVLRWMRGVCQSWLLSPPCPVHGSNAGCSGLGEAIVVSYRHLTTWTGQRLAEGGMVVHETTWGGCSVVPAPQEPWASKTQDTWARAWDLVPSQKLRDTSGPMDSSLRSSLVPVAQAVPARPHLHACSKRKKTALPAG